METVYFKGQPCHTCGTAPTVGVIAPCFHLTAPDLSQILCSDYPGHLIVLNIFPSLDTDVCARSVRRFNQEAAQLSGVTVICVSKDLPFAQGRFCSLEGIDNVVFGSAFRSPLFGQNYGVELIDGPLAGLLARCVIVLDENRRVIVRDLVDEITSEPDYDAILTAIRFNLKSH